MTAGAPTLGKFVLRILLWLPPCFAAWYFSSHYHAAVVGELALLLVQQFKSGIVSALEHPAINLVFVTTLQVHPEPGMTALLLPEVNPLLYTYGLAFFLALMLAAGAKWWKILVRRRCTSALPGLGHRFRFPGTSRGETRPGNFSAGGFARLAQ